MDQSMLQDRPLTGARLRTPKAAAVAGMLFSILVIAAFWLMWVAVPADPQEPGSWLHRSANTVALALNLLPFSGIALLWFIAVLRDRLGQREDRFFATVFLGSGLLFLGMLFIAAATAGAILIAFVAEPEQLVNSATYHFARAITYGILNIYMIKMAGVFMFTTSTLAIYTALVPRWLAILGYFLALSLLLGSYYLRWSFLIFPSWVFLVSIYIVIGDFRRSRESSESKRT
jgi:hypothetical protein